MSEPRPSPLTVSVVVPVYRGAQTIGALAERLDATLQAIAAIDKPIVWIAGNLAADIGQGHILEFLRERVAALVLFGRAGERGIESLKPFTEHMYTAEELRTAVFVARELAREGEVVLFSPACPSGDGFANYEERGAEFKRAVRDL